MTGILMHYGRERFRGRSDPLCKKGIDLGSQQQDDREVVEEKQQDDREPHLSRIVAQKVGHIEREEIEIDGESDCRYHRSEPAIAKTDVLVGYDDVNSLKQDPGNDQTGQDANDGKEES